MAQQFDETYVKLREGVFQWKDPNAPKGALRSVIMEIVFQDAIVTLAAQSDSAVNVYFSNGGGIVGAGSRDRPAAAARNLAISVAQNLDQFRKTSDTKPPKPGETKFFVLVDNDVLGVTAKEAEFRQQNHKLAPVFHAAHALVTEVQRLQSTIPTKP